MSLQALFYAYFSSGKRELISVDFIDDLPFPLNLCQNVRIGIGICIVVILIGGLLLKKIIFDLGVYNACEIIFYINILKKFCSGFGVECFTIIAK